MSLLSIEGVSKRYRRGRREYVALRNVSLQVGCGEYVVALGTRKSGRSTLLRIAAGLERPDQGVVLFKGADLARTRTALGRQLAYCRSTFSPMEGETALDYVAAGLMARRTSPRAARRLAQRALDRVEVCGSAVLSPNELDGVEAVRVALARALVSDPQLIIIDDPIAEAKLLQAGPLLALMRSVVDDGATVLMSTDDATCLSGADRVFSLDDGELRLDAEAPQAEVVHLRPPRWHRGDKLDANVGR